MEVLKNSHKFRVGKRMLYLYSYPHQVLSHGRTEHTNVRGTGVNVLQDLQQSWYERYL